VISRIPHSGKYQVRIDGKALGSGSMRREEIEARAPNWKKTKFGVEVADFGSQSFVPLDDFLTAPAGPDPRFITSSSAHRPQNIPNSGKYQVRRDGTALGSDPMSHDDIVSRAPNWKQTKFIFEVADFGSQAFVPLNDFLANAVVSGPRAVKGISTSQPQNVPNSGKYQVRRDGSLVGRDPMSLGDIVRRAPNWKQTRFTFEVADFGGNVFVSLDDFLLSQPLPETWWMMTMQRVGKSPQWLWTKERRWVTVTVTSLAVAAGIWISTRATHTPPPLTEGATTLTVSKPADQTSATGTRTAEKPADQVSAAGTVTGSKPADQVLAAANGAFAQQDYQSAIEQYAKVITMVPTYPGAFVARGNAEVALMQYDKALADYQSAIARDPKNAVAYFAAGTIHWLNGDLEGADLAFRNAIQYDPGERLYYSRLARVLDEEKKTEEMGTVYKRAYEGDNTRDWALTAWLGSVAKTEHYQDLLSLCAQLWEHGARSAPLYFYRAVANVQLKQQYDMAIADLNEVTRIDPETLALPAYLQLAEAYRNMQGHVAQCEDSLKKYWALSGYTGSDAGDPSKFCTGGNSQ